MIPTTYRQTFRKLTARDVEQHAAFGAALIAAKAAGNLANNAIVRVSGDRTERMIVSTDSFGLMFIELFRYDARGFMTAHGKLNIGVTRFHAGSGKMIMIGKYARQATEAFNQMFVYGIGL